MSMASVNPFQKASIKRTNIKMALYGVSGGGKTYQSLLIASKILPILKERGCLRGNGRIAVIDSEQESATKFADIFDFDHLPLEDASPERYIMFINEAKKYNYSLLIVDSISHEWIGSGGVLEKHADLARSQNSYTAWGEAGRKHTAFLDAIVRAPLHMICTIRAKQKTVPIMDGKKIEGVKKIGIRPIQRKDSEYEFDIVGNISIDHDLKIEKTRCRHILDKKFSMAEVGVLADILGNWVAETFESSSEEDIKTSLNPEVVQILDHLKNELKMTEKAWVSLLSRFGSSSTESLTIENARKVEAHLLSVIDKQQKQQAHA